MSNLRVIYGAERIRERLSEIAGESAIETDTFLRSLGWRRIAEAEVGLLSPQAQRYYEAYAAGVNAYVEQNQLPPEYATLELTTFAPWTPLDSVAVGKLLALDAALGGIEDIELTEALHTDEDRLLLVRGIEDRQIDACLAGVFQQHFIQSII